jgi:hypothetical protein
MMLGTFYCAGVPGGFSVRLREALYDVNALEFVDADRVPFRCGTDRDAPLPDRVDNRLRVGIALADLGNAAFAVAMSANGIALHCPVSSSLGSI